MTPLHPGHTIAFLPPEIIAEIFLSACPPWHLNREDESVNSGLTPLFLGSICRSWRDIAWSNPTLWCSFIVRVKLIPNETQKELLVQWIERTKNLLLSFSVRVNKLHENDDAGREFANTILQVLVAHSMKWRVVNLDIPPTTSIGRILSRVERRIPNLVSLSLKPAVMFPSEIPHLKMHMFHDAPFLRELSINVFFLEDFNLDWTQLTTLHVELENTECLEALRRCSKTLIHCSMECFRDDSENGWFFDLNPVVAAHLTTLEVTKDILVADAFYMILPFMTLPALRQLSLPLDNVDRIDDISAMLSRSSFPALEVLALSSLNHFIHFNGERKVLDLLAAFPSLIKARLTGEGLSLTDSFIDMLHPLRRVRDNAFPVVILPNLRVFEYDGPLSLNVTSLADMLSYRWKRPQTLPDDEHGHMAQLASVTFNGFHGFHLSEDNARAFANLAGEGMDLNLIGYSVNRDLT